MNFYVNEVGWLNILFNRFILKLNIVNMINLVLIYYEVNIIKYNIIFVVYFFLLFLLRIKYGFYFLNILILILINFKIYKN